MDKIRAFFQNKIVQGVSWGLLVVSIIALAIGGATKETVTGGVVLVFVAISAISAVVAFICDHINKDKE